MSITDPSKNCIPLEEHKVPLIVGNDSDKKDAEKTNENELKFPEIKLELHPSSAENAGIVSGLLFWFVGQYLWRTRKAKDDTDLYEQPMDRFRSKNATEKLSKTWEKAKSNNKSFYYACFAAIFPQLAFFGMVLVVEEAIRLAQPLFLGKLIMFFKKGETMTEVEAYYAAAAVALTSLLTPLIHHPYFHGLLRLGNELKVAVSSMLYIKGLSLSQSSLQKTSSGQLINLLSTDSTKFEMAFVFIHFVWLSPFVGLVYAYVIYNEIGVAAIAALLIFIFLMGCQAFLSRQVGLNRFAIAQRADDRLSVMSEIIQGIRVIKMYSWEDAFSEIVGQKRERELRSIRRTATISGWVMGVFFTSGKISLLVALWIYMYFENDLTAEKVFVASALFNACRLPFSLFLPFGITQGFETYASCKRVEKFLNLGDYSRSTTVTSVDEPPPLLKLDKKLEPSWSIDPIESGEIKASVMMNDLSTLWVSERKQTQTKKQKKSKRQESFEEKNVVGIAVKEITFEAHSGECIGIVGQVGSGKSSLLSSILAEPKILSGTLNVNGKIGYCAQEPWIFSGTIRDNILFGSEYDEARYTECVEICLLVSDFHQLSAGDMTEVGDNGSTLSGGQRARVALARAVYSNADIYLLDDPLSAVDANVGKLLYKRLFTGYFKNKLVILVTHQVHLLDDLERVILMRDSAVAGIGPINKLKTEFPELFVELENFSDNDSKKEDGSRSASRLSAKRAVSGTSSLSNDPSVQDGTEQILDALSNEVISEQAAENEAPEDVADFTEKRNSGDVSYDIYWAYIREVLNPSGNGVLLVIYIFWTQILFNFQDWWLNKWVTSVENWNNDVSLNMTSAQDGISDHYDYYFVQFDADFDFYKDAYLYMTLVLIVCGVSRCMWLRYAQLNASRRLHVKMFEGVVNTDVSFFDMNPTGRILNRFSKDINVVDDYLAFCFFEYVLGLLSCLGGIGLIFYLNRSVIWATIPLIVIFYVIRRIFLSRSRELKRLEASTRSPMNTHVTSTLAGLSTVRAFGKEDEMLRKFFEAQDTYMAVYDTTMSLCRWFALSIDLIIAVFISAVAFLAVFNHGSLSSGEVALMLVYAINLCGFFSWIVRQSAELQNSMVSVERIVEYTKLKSEHKSRRMVGERKNKIPENWPTNGAIRFENINAYYGHDKVLDNISFDIKPMEKIGIAGRTGAGKSTILRVLFGLKEASSGKIYIDNADVDDITLHKRRKGMAIIPQEPVLFIGTVRQNLDPFVEFDDDVLWDALDQCELKDVVSEIGGLMAEMQEGGGNFSVGQRQLICLARALIHHAKILVIDEATANVDGRTDAIIQKTIQTRFAKSTVLTIAHRLNTIMESDKIMVFDNGSLAEFDTPKILMNDSNSALWNLAAQSGTETALRLRKLAEDH